MKVLCADRGASALEGSRPRHVAVELRVGAWRGPTGRHQLAPDGAGEVREKLLQCVPHEVASVVHILPIVVVEGLEFEKHIHGQVIVKAHRIGEELDAARREMSHLAVESGWDDLHADIPEVVDPGIESREVTNTNEWHSRPLCRFEELLLD